MPMPLSGQISLGDARTELGYAPTQQITLNDTAVRDLFTRPSGENQLLYGYGKAFRKSLSVSISSNQVNYTVCFSNLTGYVAGKTDVTVTIAAGVYVYSTSTAVAGLTISCTTSGDTCILNNYGYIMGMGGNGGDGPTANKQGKPGGTALKLGCPTIVNNSSYIAGGGGGGGAQGAGGGSGAGGGGGAGGGNGGYGNFWTPYAAGGAGGAVGQPGSAGAVTNNPTSGPAGQRFDAGGGGGGRILPGSGGDYGVNYGQRQPVPAYRSGQGGGAGGGGAGTVTSFDSSAYGGRGGAGNSPGNGPTFLYGGAGGGGWGAPGGNGHPTSGSTGGAGGKAIDLSGYALSYGSVGTIYGGVG